ncbi:MAG: D-glycerate dehydrogenase [Burkholderiales bacterium]
MKSNVYVTLPFFPESQAALAQHFQVTANPINKVLLGENLIEPISKAEGVMCSVVDRIDEALLARCPNLKAVCNVGVGYNNIDVPACTQRGIMVTNTPGVLDESTADLAFALILAAARRVTEAEAWLRAGNWKEWDFELLIGADVHHATLGIVGMGRIGQAVARRARGFDMKVIYNNRRRVAPDIESACQASYCPLDELLRESDFVLLQLPYSKETHHLIGARELGLMKSTAILVNVARGGVVDDAALVEALKRKTIAAAGLDVFENEPKLNQGFFDLKNVVLVPHIGSATLATRKAMAMTAANNLIAALSGKMPPNLVNPESKN